jgi:hypothetical protein
MTIGSICALNKVKHCPSKWSLLALQRLETYSIGSSPICSKKAAMMPLPIPFLGIDITEVGDKLSSMIGTYRFWNR